MAHSVAVRSTRCTSRPWQTRRTPYRSNTRARRSASGHTRSRKRRARPRARRGAWSNSVSSVMAMFLLPHQRDFLSPSITGHTFSLQPSLSPSVAARTT
jgi:hypothetical protein